MREWPSRTAPDTHTHTHTHTHDAALAVLRPGGGPNPHSSGWLLGNFNGAILLDFACML